MVLLKIKIENTYEIDLTANWMSRHKGSLIFISEIFEADSAHLTKLDTYRAASEYCLKYH